MSYITSKNNFLKTEQFLSEVLPVDVLEYFSKVSFSTYVVGGAVRDWLLGKRPTDFDLVVDGDVSIIAADFATIVAGKIIELDRERHIIRINYRQENVLTTIDLTQLVDDIELNLLSRDLLLTL